MVADVVNGIGEVYQFAADMGGEGYVFTGEYDGDVMHNSATINLNMLHYGLKAGVKKFFYSSSACIYPEYNQMNPLNPKCREDSAYPAAPDSEYSWEKLFSERLYLAYMRNYGAEVRVARFHNILGADGTWCGGKEKAPAALCCKVVKLRMAERSRYGVTVNKRGRFFISTSVSRVCGRLVESTFTGPVNIGSGEMVSINQLAQLITSIAGNNLTTKNIPGPFGVRGRNSDNRLIAEKLGRKPSWPLRKGLELTYRWIERQIALPEPERMVSALTGKARSE